MLLKKKENKSEKWLNGNGESEYSLVDITSGKIVSTKGIKEVGLYLRGSDLVFS